MIEIEEAAKIAEDLKRIAGRIDRASIWQTMGGNPEPLAKGLADVVRTVAKAIAAEAERNER